MIKVQQLLIKLEVCGHFVLLTDRGTVRKTTKENYFVEQQTKYPQNENSFSIQPTVETNFNF